MKKFRLFLIVLVLVLAQIACSGDDGTVSDDPVVVDNNPTTSLTCTLSPDAPGCP